MTALLAVEARRLASRRLVRVITGLAVLGILIGAVVTFARSSREPATPFGPPVPVAPGEPLPPDPQFQFEPADRRFHLESLPAIFQGTTVPLMLLGWVLGASFVGAEWHAGTMGTLLTWEPRRNRVVVAKATVVVAAAFLSTTALQVLLGLLLWPAAAFRGTLEGVDGAWAAETAGVLFRGATLTAVFAALGFSLASVARNTAAALGVGFGYLVIFENLLGGLLPRLRPWLIVGNIVVFLTGDAFAADLVGHSVAGAGVLLAAYGAGALLVAAALFRSRDVT